MIVCRQDHGRGGPLSRVTNGGGGRERQAERNPGENSARASTRNRGVCVCIHACMRLCMHACMRPFVCLYMLRAFVCAFVVVFVCVYRMHTRVYLYACQATNAKCATEWYDISLRRRDMEDEVAGVRRDWEEMRRQMEEDIDTEVEMLRRR